MNPGESCILRYKHRISGYTRANVPGLGPKHVIMSLNSTLCKGNQDLLKIDIWLEDYAIDSSYGFAELEELRMEYQFVLPRCSSQQAIIPLVTVHPFSQQQHYPLWTNLTQIYAVCQPQVNKDSHSVLRGREGSIQPNFQLWLSEEIEMCKSKSFYTWELKD